MPPLPPKRTFIALKINPDPYFLDAFNHLKQELSSEEIRWIKPSNFHITLRFIGDTELEKIAEIQTVLSETVKEINPFSFRVEGLGIFRSISYPRVIYAGLQDTEKLCEAKRKLDKNLTELIQPESMKSFSPHLTLGRMNKCRDRDGLRRMVNEYREFEFLMVETTEIILFESIIKKEGADYYPLSSFSLG